MDGSGGNQSRRQRLERRSNRGEEMKRLPFDFVKICPNCATDFFDPHEHRPLVVIESREASKTHRDRADRKRLSRQAGTTILADEKA
jgi:hypothetical protein